MTASSTTPPARTTWTTDSGARASAATCRAQAPIATSIPSMNHGEQNSPRAERSGCLMSTGGAAQAPRCL